MPPEPAPGAVPPEVGGAPALPGGAPPEPVPAVGLEPPNVAVPAMGALPAELPPVPGEFPLPPLPPLAGGSSLAEQADKVRMEPRRRRFGYRPIDKESYMLQPKVNGAPVASHGTLVRQGHKLHDHAGPMRIHCIRRRLSRADAPSAFTIDLEPVSEAYS